MLGDVAPAIAMNEVESHDEHVFFDGPLALSDVRVQMVVPSLATLLSNASGKTLGDMGPVFGTLSDHDSGQDFIFLARPCAFSKVTAVVEFKPACMALDLRLAWQELADAIP